MITNSNFIKDDVFYNIFIEKREANLPLFKVFINETNFFVSDSEFSNLIIFYVNKLNLGNKVTGIQFLILLREIDSFFNKFYFEDTSFYKDVLNICIALKRKIINKKFILKKDFFLFKNNVNLKLGFFENNHYITEKLFNTKYIVEETLKSYKIYDKKIVLKKDIIDINATLKPFFVKKIIYEENYDFEKQEINKKEFNESNLKSENTPLSEIYLKKIEELWDVYDKIMKNDLFIISRTNNNLVISKTKSKNNINKEIINLVKNEAKNINEFIKTEGSYLMLINKYKSNSFIYFIYKLIWIELINNYTYSMSIIKHKNNPNKSIKVLQSGE